MAHQNPWAVENIEVFSYYCCPECDFKSKDRCYFKRHAMESHNKSIVFFILSKTENNTSNDSMEVETELESQHENEDSLEEFADVVRDLMEQENFHVCEMILFEKVEGGLKHLDPDEMQLENLEVHYTDDGLEGVDVENDFVEEDVEDDGLKDADDEHDFVGGDIVDVGLLGDFVEEENDQTQMKEEGLEADFVEEDFEEENDQEQLKCFGIGLEKNEGQNDH